MAKFWFVLFTWLALSSCKQNENSQIAPHNPSEALELILAGNERFAQDKPLHPDQSKKRIKEITSSQHPFAIVISCSDSRVPPELVLDQGLGDLFVIRTAGNIIGEYEMGSIVYALENFNSPLIMVIGHEDCGAIKAYVNHMDEHLPGRTQCIIEYLKNEPEEQALDKNSPNFIDAAVRANIQHGVGVIKKMDTSITKLVSTDNLKIVGAIYHMESGKIELLPECE
jgi:carbonic anhydrase